MRTGEAVTANLLTPISPKVAKTKKSEKERRDPKGGGGEGRRKKVQAIDHIINGVIGTAVLSMAWSLAQLGGPVDCRPNAWVVFGTPKLVNEQMQMKNALKTPPPENSTMKKASITALLITTALFICCGCFGYAAFSNQSPGNLLAGFYESLLA
ncbi:putative amino acid permease 7 [Forsythia ovata]|uniref:Amino acid permease 7 n=1 Tax=Forsythia ovata TaxID=205694 RepID=A0ABD1S9X6_9LAMI